MKNSIVLSVIALSTHFGGCASQLKQLSVQTSTLQVPTLQGPGSFISPATEIRTPITDEDEWDSDFPEDRPIKSSTSSSLSTISCHPSMLSITIENENDRKTQQELLSSSEYDRKCEREDKLGEEEWTKKDELDAQLFWKIYGLGFKYFGQTHCFQPGLDEQIKACIVTNPKILQSKRRSIHMKTQGLVTPLEAFTESLCMFGLDRIEKNRLLLHNIFSTTLTLDKDPCRRVGALKILLQYYTPYFDSLIDEILKDRMINLSSHPELIKHWITAWCVEKPHVQGSKKEKGFLSNLFTSEKNEYSPLPQDERAAVVYRNSIAPNALKLLKISRRLVDKGADVLQLDDSSSFEKHSIVCPSCFFLRSEMILKREE